ncbi:NF038104 family lipoprotein [Hydromonas duriensis]|uniref:Lipoprotein n=1 Tax=Hydromonas duriensis TaxID=1527608 RepID=A0A4R6YBH6_9BURK|nr:NF038104 family lipoprotein [Hydromonas duriensis]TDR33027.1 hypothetical protein DFR44_10177 [Hydromonas duriensis]
MKRLLRVVILVATCVTFMGCAVVSVAGAAVSVAATAVKTTVKAGAAVVDLAIPDGEAK